jgi:hypothetical protein
MWVDIKATSLDWWSKSGMTAGTAAGPMATISSATLLATSRALRAFFIQSVPETLRAVSRINASRLASARATRSTSCWIRAVFAAESAGCLAGYFGDEARATVGTETAEAENSKASITIER